MNFYTYFSTQQRSAIVGLVLIVLSLQFMSIPDRVFYENNFRVDSHTYLKFQNELAVQRAQKIENTLPKIYSFNPNYITDYKGYRLGMSSLEISRLLDFRAGNKWVNSATDFQKVTQVSDSLLQELAPSFKFPDWVTRSKIQPHYKLNLPLTADQKGDLNTATSNELQTIYGIGTVYSERIIKFRASFEAGFMSELQLEGVYGLSPELIDNILKKFTLKTPMYFKKININTATVNQLVTVQYIDYELAYEIIELRMLKEGYKTFEELTKVKGFPAKKLEIIKLYLTLN
jgi:DNA uptake protein ComE-like DNA-binding protein